MTHAAEPPHTLALGIAPVGRKDFRLAVRVQNRAFEGSRELAAIKKQAKDEVEMRYIGRVMKCALPWYRQRQRPLLIGCSIGHFKITAGTLGCFVQARAGGSLCVLSNNHVLANENRGTKGDAVVQCGVYDGGQVPDDTVAKLQDFVGLKRQGANEVDCAIAALEDSVLADRTKLHGLGKLAGLGEVFLNEGVPVSKIGRTTGLTYGRVTAFELDNVVVDFDTGAMRFDHQIEIEGAENEPFSDDGDSGSLIIGSDKRGVALLFAGSDQGGANGCGLTYANPLGLVLEALKVDLALA